VKNLFLKIACVLVALVTWLLVAATTMVEEDLRLPMVVVGLGEGMTVEGSTLPDMAAVRLRASKLSVMAHRYLGVSLGQVQLNLTDAVPGAPRLFELKEADVRTEAEVVSLLPPVRLPLRLDWLDTRRLPVRVPLQGQLPADHMLGGPVTVLPDSVDVTGPRRFFAGLDSLVTEPVDLASLQQSLVKDLPLVRPPAPLEAKATSVAVTVPVVELAERILANIPVIALAESHLGETGVSPPVCDVLVRGPADSVTALSPARLTVTVALAGLGPGVHQVPGFAQHPDWVTSVQLEPALFMVIIGEAPDAEEGP
jgi:hypothetical protein